MAELKPASRTATGASASPRFAGNSSANATEPGAPYVGFAQVVGHAPVLEPWTDQSEATSGADPSSETPPVW
jgi:hypothetical protein